MNSAHPLPESAPYARNLSDSDIRRMVASSFQALEQPTPPTLREILTAYRAKGDGDREMLLAMLNAKAAEDQRIAATVNLHRTVLDVYQSSFEPLPPARVNGNYHYPTPSFTHSPPCEQRSSRRTQYPRASSRSRSPQRHSSHLLPPRDTPMYHEPPRKRHRGSHSPPPTHAGAYDSHPGSQHEQFPPSPYSSSDRSDSAEYSPRSRQSMAIGSLLSSSGPSKEMNGDIQERE